MMTPTAPTPPHLIRAELGTSAYPDDVNNCPPAHLLVAEDYMLNEDEEEESETTSVTESDADSDRDYEASVDVSSDEERSRDSKEWKNLTSEKERPTKEDSPSKNDSKTDFKLDRKKMKKERKKWLNIFRSACRQNKAVAQGENEARNERGDDLMPKVYTSSDELSNESSSDDSKGHSRETSMLSTTPFASLQADIAACLFQAGITENIKARAFLEKERQLEESYKKQKEAQGQRMRSTMNTSGVEQINSDKNDNQKNNLQINTFARDSGCVRQTIVRRSADQPQKRCREEERSQNAPPNER